MATIDGIINFLDASAQSFASAAYGFSSSAQSYANAWPPHLGYASANYLSPISATTDITDCLPPHLKISPVTDVVKNIHNDLVAYYTKYFPAISTEYTQWLNRLAHHIHNGVPVYENNELQNRYAQESAKNSNARTQRKLRAQHAARGFSLPSGMLLADTYDTVDELYTRAMEQSVATATKATQQLTDTYKTLISTALATDQSRLEALSAMSNLVRAAAGRYDAEMDRRAAIMSLRAAAINTTLAYYEAELKLDSINTNIYKANTDLFVSRFDKQAELLFKIAKQKVDAAIAAADSAAMIAQAAYASLSSVASSSQVSFG